MDSSQKTKANHAFVVRGTTEASDALLEFIAELDGADLVYQKHSYANLYVNEGEEGE